MIRSGEHESRVQRACEKVEKREKEKATAKLHQKHKYASFLFALESLVEAKANHPNDNDRVAPARTRMLDALDELMDATKP